MSARLITFFLSLHFFFPTFASEIVTMKRNPDKTDGFYCDFRLFKRSYIEDSKNEALKKFSHDAASLFEGSTSQYPEVYHRPLDFGKSESYLIWPLRDPVRSKYMKDPPIYFLAIGSVSMDALGIVKKQLDEKDHKKIYVKCQISKFAEPFVQTGYQCPVEYFPREVIQVALTELKYERSKVFTSSVNNRLPTVFNGIALLNVYDPLYLWPIDIFGHFSIRAPSFLVLDSRDNLVAMIHDKGKDAFIKDKTSFKKGKNTFKKGRGIFLKCMPMASPKIEPQFIGLGLPHPNKNLGPDVLDVFQCGLTYFKSHILILDAMYAREAFIINRDRKRSYPKLVEKLFKDGDDDIYLWPALYSRRNSYPENFKTVVKSMTAFLKITDFCDIIDVVYYGKDDEERSCIRKHIPKAMYTQTKPGYIRTSV